METEWYVRTLEEDEDSGVNNNSSPPRKWSMASRPSLSSLDETLVMDHTAGPVAKLALEEKRGRRKSWHIKMERKRRKGVTGTSTPPEKGYQREKRPSWWNIFVPDHWPNRSRRASQDIRPTHTNENTAPWVRSKSRSVDHGFSPPFDLDSLRNKVEGRFESVDKLGRDGEGGKDGAPLAEKKISRMNLPPLDTITYTVVASDTLNSIAARFDITPSELSKLNRLTTRLVFPGQLLYVPDKSKGAGGQSPGSESPTSLTPTQDGDQTVNSERDLLDSLRPNSPHGAPDRAASPLPPSPVPSKPSEQRFLKVNVRHITDGQGVVGGVLLVTPNALMFDPNVSDPLVIEHGPESYGVIAPMEYVVNVAIYYDIAHMRVGHSEHHRSNAPKPEIYHAPSAVLDKSGDTLTEPGCPIHHSPGRDSLLVKDETFPELSRSSPDDEDNESVCSCAVPRDGGAFPKAFERDLVTPTNLTTEGSGSNSRQVSFESNSSTRQKSLEEKEEAKNLESFHSAEERRRSCLDHHWMAIPSMDRSVDKEEKEGVEKNEVAAENSGDESDPQGQLVKLSCHDSGIDIRDTGVGDPNALPPLPNPIVIPTKKVYSDADIILAPKSEFVPPLTNTLTGFVTNSSSLDSAGSFDGPGHRKKTSSVSFSVDSNPDTENSGGEDSIHKEDQDKQESRKNKMLKRLSYPLAWMEGFAGDKDDKDVVSSLPNQPVGETQPHSSMFSKVFSSSPINLVDFSSGLFTKTPSEERPPSITATPPPSATLLSHTPPTIMSRSPPSASQEGFSLADTAGAMFGNVGRSSVGTFIRHESTPKAPKPVAPKLDYRSMVSVDDMPELFVSFDKLIPRPARSCEDPPLYLRLRMGKPINKKIPKSTPIMSYGKKKMRPEYWFSVPRNRVDDLYNLLQLWVPQLYGDLDDMDLTGRGYELVESDTELWEEEGETKSAEHTPEGEIGELTRESWEVLSMSEELRRALYASSVGSLDLDLFLPDLVGVTEILTEEHRKKLCRHLPARAEGYMWTLVFSTSQHGFSLNSMYRKMFRMESPILMVIEDTEHNVFGALTSCALKVSDHFYGTGESLLFRFTPEFQVFNWTGDNLYFIKGNNESLSIGAGDGKFGLWLDGDLNQGRTETCTTYGNEPLSPQEDFVVKTLECWAFI